jgi:cell division transport system permease protein
MKISSFRYYFSDAFKSLKRNLTTSTASAATVMATLFILGVFVLAMVNINKLVSGVEDKVEIKVFLNKDITNAQQNDIEASLKAYDGVKEVIYESKSDALKKMTDQFSEKDKNLLAGYDSVNNPFPSSFLVSLDTPDKAQPLSEYAVTLAGVEDIGNDKEFVQAVISISKAIRLVGVVIFVLLITVSLFLIGNTIKLTVFSRRREIGIMKFVGATDWFIRWPFIIEGVIIGIIGAVIANIALFYAYKALFVQITESMLAVSLVSPYYVINTMLFVFVLGGAIIGALGSFISLRKFLNV